MKVLVTGATGFIGYPVARALLNQGAQVRLVVRRPPPQDLVAAGAEVWWADLRNPQALQGCLEDIEAVVHVAGQIRGWTFRDFFMGNTQATRNLIQEARRIHRFPLFVYYSSLAAQGPLDRRGRALGPVSHYGWSKRLAERDLERHWPAGNWVILRPAVVYGPRDRALLPYFRWFRRHQWAVAPARPRHLGMVFIHDLVTFTLWALQAPEARGQRYCIMAPDAPSIAELLKEIGRALRVSPRIVPLPFGVLRGLQMLAPALSLVSRRPGFINPDKLREGGQREWRCEDPHRWASVAKITPTDLARGLKETADFYRTAGWL